MGPPIRPEPDPLELLSRVRRRLGSQPEPDPLELLSRVRTRIADVAPPAPELAAPEVVGGGGITGGIGAGALQQAADIPTAQPPAVELPPRPPPETIAPPSREPTAEPPATPRQSPAFFWELPFAAVPIEQVAAGARVGGEFIKETAGETLRNLGRFLGRPVRRPGGGITGGIAPAPPTAPSRLRAAAAMQATGATIAERARATQERLPKPRPLAEVVQSGSLNDLIDWAAFTTAQGVVSSLPSLAGGIVGGVVAGPAGAFAGASVPGYLQNQNEVRRALREEGVDETTAEHISAIAAVPMAALDVVVPGRIGARLTGPAREQAVRQFTRRILQEAATSGLLEGVTEAAQSGISQATTHMVTGRPISVAEILEEGVAGGLTGLLLGGVGEAVTVGRERAEPPGEPPATPAVPPPEPVPEILRATDVAPPPEQLRAEPRVTFEEAPQPEAELAAARQRLEEFQATLQFGVAPSGRRLTPDQRELLERRVQENQARIAELEGAIAEPAEEAPSSARIEAAERLAEEGRPGVAAQVLAGERPAPVEERPRATGETGFVQTQDGQAFRVLETSDPALLFVEPVEGGDRRPISRARVEDVVEPPARAAEPALEAPTEPVVTPEPEVVPEPTPEVPRALPPQEPEIDRETVVAELRERYAAVRQLENRARSRRNPETGEPISTRRLEQLRSEIAEQLAAIERLYGAYEVTFGVEAADALQREIAEQAVPTTVEPVAIEGPAPAEPAVVPVRAEPAPVEVVEPAPVEEPVAPVVEPAVTPEPPRLTEPQRLAAESRRMGRLVGGRVGRELTEDIPQSLEQGDLEGAALILRRIRDTQPSGQTRLDVENLLVDVTRLRPSVEERRPEPVPPVAPQPPSAPAEAAPGPEPPAPPPAPPDRRPTAENFAMEVRRLGANQPARVFRSLESAARQLERGEIADAILQISQVLESRGEGETPRRLQNLLVDLAQLEAAQAPVAPAPVLPAEPVAPTVEEEEPGAELPTAPPGEPEAEPPGALPGVAPERGARGVPEPGPRERAEPAPEGAPAVEGEPPVQPRGVEGEPGGLGGVVGEDRERARAERPSVRPRRRDREGDAGRVRGVDFRTTDPDVLGIDRGPKTKARDNIAAIRLMKELEAEGRSANRAEQEILAKYAGWGFAPQMFEPWRQTDYTELAKELKELLTEQEYEAARNSTPNAHYTSPEVITAVWQAMERLGFERGRALEPGMGAGYFMSLSPKRPIRFTGVELDEVTGRIGKLLFPASDIRVEGFETFQIPDGFYDVAIGNVPFGDYRLYDPRYNKFKFSIHDYFFAKALDKVRPGGLVAFITSRYTMDKDGEKVRRYLAERADLVGAIRLPNSAFRRVANTEVTSDLVILRKRFPGQEPSGESWVTTQEVQGIRLNEYYARHPEMMLGTMELSGTMYRGQEPTLVAREGDLATHLAEAIARLPENVLAPTKEQATDIQRPETILAPEHVKEGAFVVQTPPRDGKLMRRQGGVLVPARTDAGKELKGKAATRVKLLVKIRDAYRAVLQSQLADESDSELQPKQVRLNRLYGEFVRKYGPINQRSGHRRINLEGFKDDPDAALVASLEHVDDDAGTYEKADVFSKRVIRPPKPIENVERPEDALVAVLNERGRVDLPRMAEISSLSEQELVRALRGQIFENPETGQWESSPLYLSGNVRAKLAAARTAAKADPRYNDNVEALEGVQPEDLPPSEIEASLGAPWIDPRDIEQFIADLINDGKGVGRLIRVLRSTALAAWTIDVSPWLAQRPSSVNEWGTDRLPLPTLVEDALNLRDPKVYDRVDGRSIPNTEATLAAQEKLQAIKTRFRDWVWEDPARAKRLHRRYNDEYNNSVLYEADGSHLTFPGIAEVVNGKPFQFRPHQKNVVWRILQTGNTLMAHAVGAGKTFAMAAAGMEAKRIGLANKPMYVVPNHMLEQFTREFGQLYPAARVLMATKKDLARDQRQRFIAKAAANEWDAIVITHSSFGRIPVSPAFEERFVRNQLAELREAMLELEEQEGRRGKRGRSLTKQIERATSRLEARLLELEARDRKDDLLAFEELGVDMLFVDEAHLFKNLYAPTKMRNVQMADAQRAMDMYMKVSYLHELTPGRNVVFATGTPISNTITEMFTMLRYLAPQELADRGMAHLDAWAAGFGDVVTQLELRPEGGFRMHSRFARFRNVGELAQLFRSMADVQTATMLKLPSPEIRGGQAEINPAPTSQELSTYQEQLVARALAIRGRLVAPEEDNMLKLTGDGRRAALDIRLVLPDAPDHPDSKVNTAVDRIHRIWVDGAEDRLTQLVFIDLSTPKSGEEFSVYDDMKDKLIRRGIPEAQIAFIHDANTDKQKAALFRKVRRGHVRVLFGSTDKMGMGTNVQDRLIALHHLDAPWRPADIEQREGRILRQGNENEQVEIIRYVTEGSFDGYIWQLLETKARFIDQVMRAEVGTREVEDVDSRALTFAEVKAIATGNPLVMEKAQVDADLARLSRLQRAHIDRQFKMRQDLATLPERIETMQAQLAEARDDATQVVDRSGDKFEITLDDQTFTKRPEAGAALVTQARAIMDSDVTGSIRIGSFAGFQLWAERQPGRLNVWILGKRPYFGSLGYGTSETGAIQVVEYLPKRIEQFVNQAEQQIAEFERRVGELRRLVDEPFPSREALDQLKRRATEINAALDLDKQQSEPEGAGVDTDEDLEDDSAPGPDDELHMPGTPGASDVVTGQRSIGYGLRGELQRPPDWNPREAINRPQVIEEIAKMAEAAGRVVPLRTGRIKGRARGIFKVQPEVARIRNAGDILGAAHETAHAIEKIVFGWPKGGPWKKPNVSRTMQKELVALGKALYGDQKPAGGYKREGFAEFVRRWIEEDDTLHRMAPTFYAWFEDEFLPAHARLSAQAARARAAVRRWREQGALERARVSMEDPAAPRQRFQRARQTFRRGLSMEKLIEMAQPLYDLARAAEQQLGKELKPTQDPFLTMSALRGTQAARTKYMVEDGMIDLAGNRVGESLAGIRSLVQGRQEDFTIYLWARRAIKLWTDPRGPRDPGLSLEDAEQVIQELESPQFGAAAMKVYAWNEGVLDYAAEASPTFAEVVERVRERDPGDYLPLQKVFEELDDMWARSAGRSATMRSPVKRLKGSGRRIKDPFPQMIAQAEQTLRAAHARMVLDQVIKLSRVEGMGNLIEEVPRNQVPVAAASIGELIDRINREVYNVDPEAPLLSVDTKSNVLNADLLGKTLTFFAPAQRAKGVDPIVPIYDQGQVRWYRVDGKLYDTLGSLDVYRLPNVGSLPILEWSLGKPAAAFRAGTTGLRASFGLLWNPARDLPTMWVNSAATANGPKMLWYWMRAMVDAALNRSLHLDTSPWLQAFIRVGGEMAQPLGQDIPHTRLAARRLFQGRVVRTVDPRNWFEWYREFIQAPEMAPRVAELRAVAKDVGWEPGQPMTLDQSLQLLLASRQVTTDFFAAGEFGRVVNRMVPFHNAAIQGPRANLRAMRRNPQRFVWRGLQLTAATLALWWLNKDEDWYKELDPREKFLHWWFPTDWPEKTLIRLPRPFEVGLFFGGLPEALVDGWYRQDPEQVIEWFRVMRKTSVPSLMPVIPSIAAEQLANQEFFFERPIVPRGLEQRPASEQYNEYTSRVAIALGRLFEVSPLRIDHAIEGMFGYVARDILQVLGLGTEEIHKETEAADIPVFGPMFRRGGEMGTRPRSVDELYERLVDARLRQFSVERPETDVERQRRLLLDDATKAVTALAYVRRYTTDAEVRKALVDESLAIAREALLRLDRDAPITEEDRRRMRQLRQEAQQEREEVDPFLQRRPPVQRVRRAPGAPIPPSTPRR